MTKITSIERITDTLYAEDVELTGVSRGYEIQFVKRIGGIKLSGSIQLGADDIKNKTIAEIEAYITAKIEEVEQWGGYGNRGR